jgi:hypothetical protein
VPKAASPSVREGLEMAPRVGYALGLPLRASTAGGRGTVPNLLIRKKLTNCLIGGMNAAAAAWFLDSPELSAGRRMSIDRIAEYARACSRHPGEPCDWRNCATILRVWRLRVRVGEARLPSLAMWLQGAGESRQTKGNCRAG